MKKKISTFSFILLACSYLMLSCTGSRPLASSAADNNPTYGVQYLFEHEGVKVYRFHDQGSYVYYTKPAGVTTSVQSDSVKTTIRTIQLEP